LLIYGKSINLICHITFPILMSLDGNIESLEREALEMGRYYYKGFGNLISAILGNAEIYSNKPDNQDLVPKFYHWLGMIETFYDQIPIADLHGRERYYPLFIVRQLLPKLHRSLDALYKGEDDEAIEAVNMEANTIVEVGNLYDESLRQLLKDIRSHADSCDFKITVKDHLNKEWYL
jgi:hypothetical protein